MVYISTYSGVLFSLKRKEILIHATKRGNHYNVECSKPVTNTVWFHSHEVVRAVRFIEVESGMLVANSGSRGDGAIIV